MIKNLFNRFKQWRFERRFQRYIDKHGIPYNSAPMIFELECAKKWGYIYPAENPMFKWNLPLNPIGKDGLIGYDITTGDPVYLKDIKETPTSDKGGDCNV